MRTRHAPSVVCRHWNGSYAAALPREGSLTCRNIVSKVHKMFGGFFGGLAGGTFSGQYRCYPVSFIDKNEAETGNKIFLPSSALDRLGKIGFMKGVIGHHEGIAWSAICCIFQASPSCCSFLAHRVPDAIQGREQDHRSLNTLRCAGVQR